MKKSSLLISIGFFVVLGAATFLLHRVQNGLKLAAPGVLLGSDPIYNNSNVFVTNVSVALPKNLPNFQSIARPILQMELDWLPPDTVFGRREYRAADGFAAQLNVVLMGRDRTSIHKPQYCLTGTGWNIIKTEVIDLPMMKPGPYSLKAMKLTTTREDTKGDKTVTLKGLYIYWFVADNQLTPDHLERMAWFARDMLTKGVMQRWAYISYFSTCYPGQEDLLFKRMKDLMLEATPEFQLAGGPAPRAPAAETAEPMEVATK